MVCMQMFLRKKKITLFQLGVFLMIPTISNLTWGVGVVELILMIITFRITPALTVNVYHRSCQLSRKIFVSLGLLMKKCVIVNFQNDLGTYLLLVHHTPTEK